MFSNPLKVNKIVTAVRLSGPIRIDTTRFEFHVSGVDTARPNKGALGQI
jgi:hypothetical protein